MKDAMEEGPLTEKRRGTRCSILDAISSTVTISDRDRLRVMRNPGADALDAILAAMGAALAVAADDHRATARHPRYRLEGRLYV